MNTVVHRLDGAEAWFTLEGAMCLETSAGTRTGPRPSAVLILQDATKPRSTPAPDWTPRGLCAKR